MRLLSNLIFEIKRATSVLINRQADEGPINNRRPVQQTPDGRVHITHEVNPNGTVVYRRYEIFDTGMIRIEVIPDIKEHCTFFGENLRPTVHAQFYYEVWPGDKRYEQAEKWIMANS